MSKHVSFQFTKGQWPGEIPPHIAAKWKPEQLDTLKDEGYYGKKRMAEDDLPNPLYRIEPCPDFVSPFLGMSTIIVDTEALNPRPFFDQTREIALTRILNQQAAVKVSIAELEQQIAEKMLQVEKERHYQKEIAHNKNLYLNTVSGLKISTLFAEAEVLKLKIKKEQVYLELKLKDEWEAVQKWNP